MLALIVYHDSSLCLNISFRYLSIISSVVDKFLAMNSKVPEDTINPTNGDGLDQWSMNPHDFARGYPLMIE
jgi:hypothetical protein